MLEDALAKKKEELMKFVDDQIASVRAELEKKKLNDKLCVNFS